MSRPFNHFFSRSGNVFGPTESALSRWGNDSLNGPAVVGLAAWSLERDFSADGFLPTRLTADLFKAARRVPTEVRTRLVRDGRRIRNSECEVRQDGVVVARVTMVQYRQSEAPPGREWISQDSFTAPTGVAGPAYVIGSDDAGWSDSGAHHQNASRKRVYHRTPDVVEGEAPSPFVRVQADSHWCPDGISVGTSTLFDDAGPFGTAMVTAIANPAAQIDFDDR